jgi:uncharacterized protein
MSRISPELAAKAERAKAILFSLGKVAVSFSGGVDSTLVLRLAVDACGPENVLALTGVSPTLPGRELSFARETARRMGVELVEFETGEVENEAFRANPPDRCYHCKRLRLAALRRVAGERGFGHIVEGTNRDDLGDYRPGLRASEEAGSRSPLLEAGLGKAEVRALSQALGLEGYDRPAAACLASRLPYGTEVTPERLRQVEQAEDFLHDLGFALARVRHHGEVARIEVAPEDRMRLLELAEDVHDHLSALGFLFVTLDLRGYSRGSLNRLLGSEGAHPPGELRKP